MPSFRTDRISQDVKKELADIQRQLKDPRITGLVSILRVEVTNDLSFANVYVSSLDGMEGAEKAVEGFKSAKGFIRREIGKRLKLRKMPEFIFIPSDSIEYSQHIDETLRKLGDK